MVVTVGESAQVRWDKPAGAGAAQVTVTPPSGSPVTLSAVEGPTGVFSAVVATTVPGRHLLAWERADARMVDILDVWPADPRYLVAVADVATTLGRSDSSPAIHVAVATWIVESLTGPVLPTDRSWSVAAGAGVAVLPDVDVTMVAITVDGAPWSGTPEVDEMAGIVSGLPTRGKVAIGYAVGSDVIPPPLRSAAHDIAVHLARSSRQATGVGQSEPAGDTVPTAYGFAIPRRAFELCQSVKRRPAGMA